MWRIVFPQPAAERPGDRTAAGRRGFLRGSLFAGLGALVLGLPLQLERFLGAAFDRRSDHRFEVAAGQAPRPGEPPRYFKTGRFYLVNLRPGEGGFREQAGSPRGGIVALEAK